MKYEKPPFTFEAQADKLLGEGLLAEREALIERLQVTNYFRFCAYVHHFRQPDGFCKAGTTLEQVWRLYTFDHRLRMLCLDAIESIEVHVRTQLAYHFAHAHGPFAYLTESNLPGFDSLRDDFRNWEKRIRTQVQRSRDPKGREEFVVSYFQEYGDSHDILPVWMMVELLDFGGTLSFYRGVAVDIRKMVAAAIGQPEEVILSWLIALNIVRNRCAHHARLWNWKSGSPAWVPNSRKFPQWHKPLLPQRSLGFLLLVFRHWMGRINPGSGWPTRIESLFASFPEITLSEMGLPQDWRNHPVWKTASS